MSQGIVMRAYSTSELFSALIGGAMEKGCEVQASTTHLHTMSTTAADFLVLFCRGVLSVDTSIACAELIPIARMMRGDDSLAQESAVNSIRERLDHINTRRIRKTKLIGLIPSGTIGIWRAQLPEIEFVEVGRDWMATREAIARAVGKAVNEIFGEGDKKK